MKKEGKTIVFITHKLNETKAVADRVTVLRGGQSVCTVETEGREASDFANLMVGHEVTFDMERPEVEKGDVVLSLKNVRLLPNAQNTVSPAGISNETVFCAFGNKRTFLRER